jgi:putative transposase
MLKSYKYCIQSKKEQQKLLQNNFNAARDAYKRNGVTIELKELKSRLSKLCNCYSCLKEVCNAVLQQSVINLDRAFKKFSNKQIKYFQFKSKRSHQAIQYPANVILNNGDSKIYLPKIGDIKIILHRNCAIGRIKTVTISKTILGKYFASMLIDDDCEITTQIQTLTEDKIISIDAIIINILHCSDNKAYQIRLAKVQKDFARKTNKSSKRISIAKQKIAKIYEKITNIYNDFQHKLSAALVDENQAIEVETFMIKNLIKNSKLAKVITDTSIRSLYAKIDKRYSSIKACFNCYNVKDLMKFFIKKVGII